MRREDIQAILDIKKLFAEAEDKEALFSQFIENGAVAEELSSVLDLTEEDINQIASETDIEPDIEKSEPIQLDEEEPDHVKMIMTAIIDEKPADVQSLFHQAITSRLNDEVDRIKYELYGYTVSEETDNEEEPEEFDENE